MGILSLLIVFLVVLAAASVIAWGVNQLALPHPWKGIALFAVAVVFTILLLSLVFGWAPLPAHWR